MAFFEFLVIKLSFLAVQCGTWRDLAVRYAKNAETLGTADYADDADGSWWRLPRRSFVRRRNVIRAIRGYFYFGANEATIFSKHGSPRSGSQNGINFKSP